MNQARVVADQIDVLVAVNVPDERPLAARERERIWPVVGSGASISTRHHVLCALPQLHRLHRRRAVTFLNIAHRLFRRLNFTSALAPVVTIFAKLLGPSNGYESSTPTFS